jgi:hypothetical protein
MPDQPQIAYHLGMAYKAQGDNAKAREALQKAVANSDTYRGYDDAKRALAAM